MEHVDTVENLARFFFKNNLQFSLTEPSTRCPSRPVDQLFLKFFFILKIFCFKNFISKIFRGGGTERHPKSELVLGQIFGRREKTCSASASKSIFFFRSANFLAKFELLTTVDVGVSKQIKKNFPLHEIFHENFVKLFRWFHSRFLLHAKRVTQNFFSLREICW